LGGGKKKKNKIIFGKKKKKLKYFCGFGGGGGGGAEMVGYGIYHSFPVVLSFAIFGNCLGYTICMRLKDLLQYNNIVAVQWV